jgi:hypothetical protein
MVKLSRTIAICTLCAFNLVACSTTQVALTYSPPPGAVAAPQAQSLISVGRFSDDRGEPSNWLGAIRGGYGNPLKNLETNEPVSDLVSQAFAAGLKARGLAANSSGGRYLLSGSIKKLDCNQVARREANAELEVVVSESDGEKRVFSNLYRASNVEGSVLSLATGVFASVESLRVLAEKTLQQVVDQALDDPALRGVIRADSPAPTP